MVNRWCPLSLGVEAMTPLSLPLNFSPTGGGGPISEGHQSPSSRSRGLLLRGWGAGGCRM